ncbi:N-acetylmuramic acid 6-phosphate etherase [Arachidicoccus soli]|uniref:N-acetylmuramic acid 6-phosphate etherase n=1 Tax=Arachidicoccus soli TaxID=2341117 RepID=A0A386HNC4_9BACT|nr:N-acetylmuramic acid 6-phosphate etherase [Arachidicoccus soli]AYD47253.1 N-acetylmuramic acid 6-phosphate etherase [Arachidicoccus soli]
MESFIKVTEESSHYHHLEKMTIGELLTNMNREDLLVAEAVGKSISQIENLIQALVLKMKSGGRLFYIGAGTSGRLGVLDASECPPTFGVDKTLITGVIAGGEKALTNPIEHAEDSLMQGWKDLMRHHVSIKDMVIGLSTSGTTPYVLSALERCKEQNILTGSITCNHNSPIAHVADFPIEVIVGPEFLTGSTRLKAGTAEKMVLNMISTSAMIQLGKVLDNKMINMQLSNDKLIDRGARMLMQELNIEDYEKAKAILLQYGTVAKALNNYAIEK